MISSQCSVTPQIRRYTFYQLAIHPVRHSNTHVVARQLKIVTRVNKIMKLENTNDLEP